MSTQELGWHLYIGTATRRGRATRASSTSWKGSDGYLPESTKTLKRSLVSPCLPNDPYLTEHTLHSVSQVRCPSALRTRAMRSAGALMLTALTRRSMLATACTDNSRPWAFGPL